MRQRYCRECGGWHDLAEIWPHEQRWVERSHLSAPMIISDTMPDLKSMADGKYYSSKSALRKGYKAKGLIEVGNDAPRSAPTPKYNEVSDKDVRRAYEKVRQGYKPKKLAPIKL